MEEEEGTLEARPTSIKTTEVYMSKGIEYKGYLIVNDRTFGYFEVKHTGKGSLPKALSGRYTKSSIAMRDIDTYTNSKESDKE